MQRIDLTPVYVLHTRPFRNASLIAELFSETYGRISVVARSARGQKSRYQGQLQLFTPILASWFGHHELKTLAHIELQEMPHQLQHSALFSGFYLNELLVRALHKEDAHSALFAHYRQSLQRLENHHPIESILRLFEKKLLEELGFGLPLHYEAQKHVPLSADAFYDFIPSQGFCVASQGLFSGRDLLAIASENFKEISTLQTAKRLMRVALRPILGEKPLNSRELFAISVSTL